MNGRHELIGEIEKWLGYNLIDYYYENFMFNLEKNHPELKDKIDTVIWAYAQDKVLKKKQGE